ncbi:MAG: tRNA (adenosine(37)-N6)-threonylcarbamoyltransferase complex ATPase subunit type 1 TsaE [Spirochaetales bacterium]
MTVRSETTEHTQIIARQLGASLVKGSLVYLCGPLGSGKTVFARGVASALGVEGPITSPTFTIVNEYHGALPLLHLDLYRVDSAEEYELLGIEEQFASSVVLVEWPDRADGALPEPTHVVEISVVDVTRREITISFFEDNV